MVAIDLLLQKKAVLKLLCLLPSVGATTQKSQAETAISIRQNVAREVHGPYQNLT
jgi:hypothetical protein